MGTPALAAIVLERLASEHEVVGVFTRPDAVRSRGKSLQASPVKQCARKHGIEVFTPRALKGEEELRLIEKLAPDVICVAAYGAILPKAILDVPRFGCVNVHTSLLPRWRGAAPIERAILSCDEVTGVCIMKMEEGLDTGPFCIRHTTPVGDKYLFELTEELAHLGASGLMEALATIEDGTVAWIDQGKDGVTYASKIEKSELMCDTSDSAERFVAKVHASSDSRPCRLNIAGRRLAVERASRLPREKAQALEVELEAGNATFVHKRLIIGTADGLVEIEQVKPDGKKSMDGRSFASGIQGIKGATVMWGKS